MDYIDGIPALQTGDPISLVPQYTQELRDAGFRYTASGATSDAGTVEYAGLFAIGRVTVLSARIADVTYTSGTTVIANIHLADFRPSRYEQWDGYAIGGGAVKGLVQTDGALELRWSSEPLTDRRISLTALYIT